MHFYLLLAAASTLIQPAYTRIASLDTQAPNLAVRNFERSTASFISHLPVLTSGNLTPRLAWRATDRVQRRGVQPESSAVVPVQPEFGVEIPVHIAIFGSRGNIRHWALCLEDTANSAKSILIHVVDDEEKKVKGYFKYNIKYYDTSTTLYKDGPSGGMIPLGTIPRASYRRLVDVSQGIEIWDKKSLPGWHCQYWILSFVTELAARRILDENDSKFKTGLGAAEGALQGIKSRKIQLLEFLGIKVVVSIN